MNIKILAQNIVNNPSDFTAEQIEKYFEDYAELRLYAFIGSFSPSEIWKMAQKYNCEYLVKKIEEVNRLNEL